MPQNLERQGFLPILAPITRNRSFDVLVGDSVKIVHGLLLNCGSPVCRRVSPHTTFWDFVERRASKINNRLLVVFWGVETMSKAWIAVLWSRDVGLMQIDWNMLICCTRKEWSSSWIRENATNGEFCDSSYIATSNSLRSCFTVQLKMLNRMPGYPGLDERDWLILRVICRDRNNDDLTRSNLKHQTVPRCHQ